MAVGPLWTSIRVVKDASSTVTIPPKRLGPFSARRGEGLEGFASAVMVETAVREHAGGAPGKKGGRSRWNVDVEVGVGWVTLISRMRVAGGGDAGERMGWKGVPPGGG